MSEELKTFTITGDWLVRYSSQWGAWTRDQFEAIGLEWMPAKGWKYRVIGELITEAQRLRFEAGLNWQQAAAQTHPDLFG